MDLKIRQARNDEIDIAYQLFKEAALRLKNAKIDQWQYWLSPPSYKVKWLKEGFRNGYYYMVLCEDVIVGMYRLSPIDLEYWGEKNDTARYIHSLVVKTKYKGQSVGSKILDLVEKELLADQIPVLRLDCHSGNEKLCQYYEKRGFEKIGEVVMPHSKNNLYEKKLM